MFQKLIVHLPNNSMTIAVIPFVDSKETIVFLYEFSRINA